jgi:hypothetical protein
MSTIAAGKKMGAPDRSGRERVSAFDRMLRRAKRMSPDELGAIVAAASEKLADTPLEAVRRSALDFANDRGICRLVGVPYETAATDVTSWRRLVVFAMLVEGHDPAGLLKR